MRPLPRRARRFLGALGLNRIANAQNDVDTGVQAATDEAARVRCDSAWLLGVGDPRDESRMYQSISDLLEMFERATTTREIDTYMGGLTQIGPPAIPALIEALNGTSERRWMAARTLAAIKDKSAVPSLLRALKDPDRMLRKEAAHALAYIGDTSAVPGLLETLIDTDQEIRQLAGATLVTIGEPGVEFLVKALQDGNQILRWGVVDVLGAIGDPAAVPALVERLAKEEHLGRAVIAIALGKIGGRGAVAALLGALGKDPDGTVRAVAAEALGTAGDATAVAGLLQALDDGNEVVRERAASVLIDLGAPAISGLIKAMGDERPHVSQLATGALSRGGRPAVLGLLEVVKHHERGDLRANAALLLGMMGDDAATGVLTDALQDNEEVVRLGAAWALAKIKEPPADPEDDRRR